MVNHADVHNPKTIHVLIVDDHPLFREGLQKALSFEDDIVVVGHSADGSQALLASRELQPDVILLDINLPGMNGLQVANKLKAERSHVAIIILTAYHDAEQVIHAFRSGASAYCIKDVTPDELVAIIRDAAQGYYIIEDQRMLKDELEQWLHNSIHSVSGYAVDADEHYIPLSSREMQILYFVTSGMSNKEIAVRLGISQQTVKNHMTSILRKLNVGDRTQAAVMALRRGWVRLYGDQDSS